MTIIGRLILLLLFLLLSPASRPFAESRKTIVDVLSNDSRFTNLIEALQRTRLIPLLNHLETGTFFAPINEAFEDGSFVTTDRMLYHILWEEIKGEELKDGQLLTTRYEISEKLGEGKIGQKIKIEKELGKLGKEVKYVGNGKIIETDLQADNGIIHVIDNVLTTPMDALTTLDSIDQLEIFTTYLRLMDLDRHVKVGSHITLFTPTDDSITKRLKHYEREYLTGNCGGGFRDLDLLVKHHLHYEDVLYTTNFTHKLLPVDTAQGEPLKVVRDDNDVIHVADGSVTYKDLLAYNGVIHIIDDIAVPKALFFNAHKYLCGLRATKFVSALIKYRLNHYIEDLDTPYTILAPHDDYYDNRIFADGADVLKYHILNGTYKIEDFKNKMLVQTELITKDLKNKRQRITVTVKSTWVKENNETEKSDTDIIFNDAYVLGSPVKIGNSMIYILSKTLRLPSDIVTIAIRNKQLSNFKAAIEASGMLPTVQQSQGVTVFAPTNLAFSNLDLLIPYFLSPYGKDDLREVVGYHMLDDIIYTEGIPQGESQYTTIDGTPLNITRDEKDHLKVKIENGTSEITQRDILTSTGVMHVVDAVQLPPTLHVTVGKILNGIGATSMLEIFKISNLSEILDDPIEPFTIFSPTNEAFRKINITKLMNDPDRVSRLIRLHVIPHSVDNLREGKELNTMLSDDAKLVVRKDILYGGYRIEVKGGFFEDKARIRGMGKAWNGGAVYEVDKVLNPVRPFPHIGRVFFGVVLGILASLILITLVTYVWHHWVIYQRRAGYNRID
ncbi:FAS1 domain-containing protein [Gigaspora rosea]|uniref:FAS1 domain-containing protein n=1 Tax=Gigaspora rosea TaxID=44941 RepID=A0A397UIG0_9GLOM|nr:FAS1 domain-containing protein [Gigaspora rosea]